jgi:hypothetical protein
MEVVAAQILFSSLVMGIMGSTCAMYRNRSLSRGGISGTLIESLRFGATWATIWAGWTKISPFGRYVSC